MTSELTVNDKPSTEEITGKSFGVLQPGFAWNPLTSLPRNMLCPCGSQKKYKKCHLDKMPKAIPEKLAAEWRQALKDTDPNIIKFTHDEKDSNTVA